MSYIDQPKVRKKNHSGNANPLKMYQTLERELNLLIGEVRFNVATNLRLERIHHLLDLLDRPQNDFPVIHVGGTSGKGSTSVMISSILTESGLKTGLHLSPHLQIFNERHQINNQLAPTRRLLEIFRKMKPAIQKVGAENKLGAPTYFEAQVALALCYFREEKVDAAVVEVGLGGTLDGTNVVPAKVAVLTNVGLDHTEILGDTIEKIAYDKAGIIKPGQIVVCGMHQPTARQIVIERCQEKNATLWLVNQDFGFAKENLNGYFDIRTPDHHYEKLHAGMVGDFQMANATCAITAAQALINARLTDSAIRRGLEQAKIPGRVEQMQERPTVILDGAHNPDKMEAAAQLINKRYCHQRRIVVLSLKTGKVIEDILPFVVDRADELVITAFKIKGLWEPAKPEEIAETARKLRPDLSIQIIPEPMAAFKKALELANKDDLVWVTGSFYLIGDIREYWYPNEKLIEQAEMGLSGAMVVGH